ncbi:hypothetical protein [Helicobacter pullorum]|uniref:Uncharacterized protein n=1 Tax=Helicobacter pullorum TaxID=35818 RepID=A0A0N1EHS0_9HELI|nr:hypothetical protein [Helicobacter pullorum]KPH55434.1 hypothetical protein HPU229334_08260 [Helicobacter pullorum]
MLRIIPTKHFLERCSERKFELSLIPEIIKRVREKPTLRTFEVTNGAVTFIVQHNQEEQVCLLVTGWVGNRHKKAM